MTEPQAPKFLTVPLKQLQSPSSHPEVSASPLQRAIGLVRLKACNYAITNQGEVLGFWLSELPETVPVESESVSALTVQNLSLKVVRQWQKYDCVRLVRKTRDCGVFVPEKHWKWLPLPIIRLSDLSEGKRL